MRHWINQLENVAGLEVFPIISLLIFLCFFVAVGIYMFLIDNKYVQYMKQRPLEEDEPDTEPNSL